MRLFRKTLTFEGLENLNVDFIEKFIEEMGFQPLRWAVVEIKENKFNVEAVVINLCNKK